MANYGLTDCGSNPGPRSLKNTAFMEGCFLPFSLFVSVVDAGALQQLKKISIQNFFSEFLKLNWKNKKMIYLLGVKLGKHTTLGMSNKINRELLTEALNQKNKWEQGQSRVAKA